MPNVRQILAYAAMFPVVDKFREEMFWLGPYNELNVSVQETSNELVNSDVNNFFLTFLCLKFYCPLLIYDCHYCALEYFVLEI